MRMINWDEVIEKMSCMLRMPNFISVSNRARSARQKHFSLWFVSIYTLFCTVIAYVRREKVNSAFFCSVLKI